MKISTSPAHGMRIAGTDAAGAARMMVRAGFQGVDFSLCDRQMEPEKIQEAAWHDRMTAAAEALKAEGLEIAQTHLPYYYAHIPHPGSGTYGEYEAFMLPSYLRALEVTAEIGCHLTVMHPYYVSEDAARTRDGNRRLLDRLLPSLEKYDIRLALENIWAWGYQNANASYPEDLYAMAESAGDRHIGLCIDTGHANLFRIDICAMARMYGKKLYALHINGNGGTQDEHILPYTMAGHYEKLDYRGFSAALREIGFRGWYNLEIGTGDMPACLAQPYYDFAAAVARALADLAEPPQPDLPAD